MINAFGREWECQHGYLYGFYTSSAGDEVYLGFEEPPVINGEKCLPIYAECIEELEDEDEDGIVLDMLK